MADWARLGPVHSHKWCEILTSGVFAAWVIENLSPGLEVLDLGCNAGYWCEWAAKKNLRPTGLDRERRLIELGQSVMASRSPDVKLVVGDLRDIDHAPLSANMLETPNPRKFSVEGGTGSDDVDELGGPADGGGDRSGGESGPPAVHGGGEAAGAARGRALHEAGRVERAAAA
jgi:SAM-dependent methyltransferase